MKPRPLRPCRAIAFGMLVTVTTAIWFWSATHRLLPALCIACPGAAFTGMLLLGSERVPENLKLWIHEKPARVALVPTALWLLYLVYATGMEIVDGGAALAIAIYLSVPFIA